MPINDTSHAKKPQRPDADERLRLFVYGTLKRGFGNHDRYCRGALTVEEASVRGRLFEFSSGIPVLEIPHEDILAVGTTDPLADLATQARAAARIHKRETPPAPLPRAEAASPWGPVYGELLTFDDPRTRLPAIDRLEGLHPAGPSLYQRVLAPVRTSTAAVPAWLYVAANPPRSLTPLGTPSWPRQP